MPYDELTLAGDDKFQDLLWHIGRIDEVPVTVGVRIKPDVLVKLEDEGWFDITSLGLY